MGRDGPQDWFLTSEFADLAGVTVRTLHYYDRVGLLKVARTSAGYRRWPKADEDRMREYENHDPHIATKQRKR